MTSLTIDYSDYLSSDLNVSVRRKLVVHAADIDNSLSVTRVVFISFAYPFKQRTASLITTEHESL